MKYFSILITIYVTVKCVYSANILSLLAGFPKSHVLAFSSLFKGLSERGHNMTLLTFYPESIDSPLSRIIEFETLDVLLEKLKVYNFISGAKTDLKSMYLRANHLAKVGYLTCETLFKSKNLQEFLKQSNAFDLILFEDFFLECLWPLTQMYSAPVISLVSHTLAPWNGKSVGNPFSSAYIPNVHLNFSVKMSFFGRLLNFIKNVYDIYYYESFVKYNQKEIAKKYLPVNKKTFDPSFYNVSLVLLNTYFTVSRPKPLVPSIIEVGGIHIGEPKKLSKDIEQWINGSEHGVIYFSLGSVIKGHTIPTEKKKAFLNAFKRLPQRVIWKWENDTMEGKTDNILIGKWMPQFDILSHPNVKAFISHGGLLGTMEAVHCGVPVMVMPQFGDQHTNAKALESVGGGVILYMNDANEETIYQSLKKILEPKFQAQAKELSERFRDRPMPPLETAIYWVEYVARHKGAHFMKTAAVNMPFYQYYLLDVIAFLVVVSSIIFYSVYISLKFLLKKVTSLFKKPVTPMKHKKS